MDKIGIQLEESLMKWATLSSKKNLIVIETLQTKPLSLESEANPLPFSKDDFLISGLEVGEVLFRNLDLPTHEKRKIFKLLPFQIESHLPYPIEEAVMGLQLSLDSKAKQGRASVFSIRSQNLEAHIEKLSNSAIDVSQVSCSLAALSRFFHFFFPSCLEAIYLHVEEKMSIALYIEKGSILFSHTFPMGLDKISKDGSFLQMQKELNRIFAFLEKKIPDTCESFLLTGDFSKNPHFPDFVEENLPSSLQKLLLPNSRSFSSFTISSYAVPIGLALEGLMKDGKSISFCKESFATPFMKEKRRKRTLNFMKATLAFSCCLFLMGNLYLETKKNKLLKGFSLLIPDGRSAVSTLEALEEEIHFLEIKEKKERKNYSIALPLPNVSETLAFLSAHPTLQKEIEILKVDYSLVKYPKATSPKDPYIGKVTLELLIPNPKSALSFYEKFSQNNPLIHTKKEISWEEKHPSTYHLSFFLTPRNEASL